MDKMSFESMVKEIEDIAYSLITMSLMNATRAKDYNDMAARCLKISKSLEEWQQALEGQG